MHRGTAPTIATEGNNDGEEDALNKKEMQSALGGCWNGGNEEM